MTSGTIQLGDMKQELHRLVTRNGGMAHAPQYAQLTLVILDICLTLGGHGSLTMLVTSALRLPVTPGTPAPSLGPLLVLAAEAVAAWVACADVLRRPVTPFLWPDARSFATLGAPRHRSGAVTGRRFMTTRLPLVVACFALLAPTAGWRTADALDGSGLGGVSVPLAIVATIVASWLCAGLLLSARSDRHAMAGVAVAAVVEAVATLYAPHAATPAWVSGFQLLALAALLTVAFSALVEGPRSRRIADMVADATPIAEFSPFHVQAPAPSYVRIAAGPSPVVVFTKGSSDARYVAVDVRDPRATLPVHDRAVLVWNLGHLRAGLQGGIEGTYGDLFRVRCEVGTLASTVGLFRHGDAFDGAVIGAASDLFFMNADLRGLVGRAVSAALATYVERVGEGLAALRREAEDDLAALRAYPGRHCRQAMMPKAKWVKAR